MSDAPSLGNVEAEEFSQLGCRLTGYGVPPGAERNQKVSVLIKGEIAVHHSADAEGTDLLQVLPEFFLYVSREICVACVHALMDLIHGIGPDPVHQLVFPVIASGGYRQMILIHQYRLDPCGSELDPDYAAFPVHPVFLSLISRVTSPLSGRDDLVLFTYFSFQAISL